MTSLLIRDRFASFDTKQVVLADVYLNDNLLQRGGSESFTENTTLACVHWQDALSKFSSALTVQMEKDSACLLCNELLDNQLYIHTLLEQMYELCQAKLLTIAVCPFTCLFSHPQKSSIKGMAKKVFKQMKEFIQMCLKFELDIRITVKSSKSTLPPCDSVSHRFQLERDQKSNEEVVSLTDIQRRSKEAMKNKFAEIERELQEQRQLMEKEFSFQMQQYESLRTSVIELLDLVSSWRAERELKNKDSSLRQNESSSTESERRKEKKKVTFSSPEKTVREFVTGSASTDCRSSSSEHVPETLSRKSMQCSEEVVIGHMEYVVGEQESARVHSKTSVPDKSNQLKISMENTKSALPGEMLEKSNVSVSMFSPIRPLSVVIRKFLSNPLIPEVTVEEFRKVDRETGISFDELSPFSEEDDELQRLAQLLDSDARRRLLPSGNEMSQIVEDLNSGKFRAKLQKENIGATRAGRNSVRQLLNLDVFKSDQPDNVRLWHGMEEALAPETEVPLTAETGMDTVLCIDTSASITLDALQDVQHILYSFIDGVEEVAEKLDIEENVAMVTCGGSPRVLHHLTNDYGCLREITEKLTCHGHSPLLQGLLFCFACVTKGGVCQFGEFVRIPPRIIVLTDGQASGEDARSESFVSTHEERKRLLKVAKILGSQLSKQNLTSQIVWVPVGNADKMFLKNLANVSQGLYVEAKDIEKLSTYHSIQRLTADVMMFMKTHNGKLNLLTRVLEIYGANYSMQSWMKVSDSVSSSPLISPNSIARAPDNFDNILFRETLPPIGTRVIRGPEWKYEHQDGLGPGTVINHDTDDEESMWVIWDCGHRNVYRCGPTSGYDVLPTDNIKVLDPDKVIDIGVVVERGPDWPESYANQDGGPGSRGVVVRMKGSQVKVRWENGNMHDYIFGEDDEFHLTVCSAMRL